MFKTVIMYIDHKKELISQQCLSNPSGPPNGSQGIEYLYVLFIYYSVDGHRRTEKHVILNLTTNTFSWKHSLAEIPSNSLGRAEGRGSERTVLYN